jgi:hypothetical protein
LRDVTETNIVVNWGNLKEAGVERNAPVTVKLRNVKFSTTIRGILDSAQQGNKKLTYLVEGGTISIATAEELMKHTATRIYDVRDILQAARYSAVKHVVVPGPHPIAAPAVAIPTEAEVVKKLLTLIEDTVANDSWKDHGGPAATIREFQGQLSIAQTWENQRAISNLLDELREGQGNQVQIQVTRRQNPPRLSPAHQSALNFAKNGAHHT